MSRAGKNWEMAVRMAKMSAPLAPGKVIGVAGNTMAHAKELIELVYVAAKQLNVSVSHVTFKPIGADELVAPSDKTKH